MEMKEANLLSSGKSFHSLGGEPFHFRQCFHMPQVYDKICDVRWGLIIKSLLLSAESWIEFWSEQVTHGE